MIDVKISWKKTLKVSLQRTVTPIAAALAEVGQMIHRRITTRGVDAEGKALPPLAGTGKDNEYWVPEDDPRFPRAAAGADTATVQVHPGAKATERDKARSVKVQLFAGYAAAKKAMGAQPRRDGELTGSMWKALKVRVGQGKNGRVFVRLYFAGNDRQQISYGASSKGKVSKRSLRQRTKAERLMFVERKPDGSPTGKQAFELLRMDPAERRFFLGRVAGEIQKLFAAGGT